MFRGNTGVLSQAATEAKTVPEYKETLQLICSALLKKTIDNAVKDFCINDCRDVSANGGHFTHIM